MSDSGGYPDGDGGGGGVGAAAAAVAGSHPPRFSAKWDECVALEETPTDITTGDEYGNFDFQVSEPLASAATTVDRLSVIMSVEGG